MCLYRHKEKVLVTPQDSIGMEHWEKALGRKLDKPFPVLGQIGVDTVFLESERGTRVPVPYTLISKV